MPVGFVNIIESKDAIMGSGAEYIVSLGRKGGSNVAAAIVNALMYARRAGRPGWWVLIVLNALLILCGLVVLVNPWWNEPTKLFDVIGGMLLFSSVVSVVRTIFNWPIKGE